MDGRAGAFYCIWWGEVNGDSDGPLEWCRPVPTDQAEQLAIQVQELVLRDEPAHREAFIHLGRFGQIEPAQYQLITHSLLDWVQEHTARPPWSDGIRRRGRARRILALRVLVPAATPYTACQQRLLATDWKHL
jgi:hypothetical protein